MCIFCIIDFLSIWKTNRSAHLASGIDARFDKTGKLKGFKLPTLDYTQEKPWLTTIDSLRILVGVLGVLLPVLLWLFLLVDSGLTSPLPSISHYYFTRANPVLIIVVSLLGIFLLIYRYKELPDFLLTTFAGTFALCLLLFPTSNLCEKLETCPDHVTTLIHNNTFRELFHYISAAIFLGCLAAMALFRFTKTAPGVPPTGRKLTRNWIYKICGWCMIVALLIIFPGSKFIPSEIYDANNLTFWMETAAVEAFGVSWLVKAEVVLKDHVIGLPKI